MTGLRQSSPHLESKPDAEGKTQVKSELYLFKIIILWLEYCNSFKLIHDEPRTTKQ